jgi:hypothetical protein
LLVILFLVSALLLPLYHHILLPQCLCNTEAEDANSLRHHLSDAHGLWKAEWRIFGRKRGPEKDEKDVDPASMPNSEDTCETIPCKGRKRTKPGDTFIEWSPPLNLCSPHLLRTSKCVRAIVKTSLIYPALSHCCVAIVPVCPPNLMTRQGMKSQPSRASRSRDGWRSKVA